MHGRWNIICAADFGSSAIWKWAQIKQRAHPSECQPSPGRSALSCKGFVISWVEYSPWKLKILYKRRGVSQNYIMDHAKHSVRHVESISFFFFVPSRPPCPLHLFLKTFLTRLVHFPITFERQPSQLNWKCVAVIRFVSRRFNEVMNQQRTSLLPLRKVIPRCTTHGVAGWY